MRHAQIQCNKMASSEVPLGLFTLGQLLNTRVAAQFDARQSRALQMLTSQLPRGFGAHVNAELQRRAGARRVQGANLREGANKKGKQYRSIDCFVANANEWQGKTTRDLVQCAPHGQHIVHAKKHVEISQGATKQARKTHAVGQKH